MYTPIIIRFTYLTSYPLDQANLKEFIPVSGNLLGLSQ